MDQGALKKMAADAAVEYVKDGQIVGLGTGSTLRYVVAKLGERVKKGLRIRGVATSLETARLARRACSSHGWMPRSEVWSSRRAWGSRWR